MTDTMPVGSTGAPPVAPTGAAGPGPAAPRRPGRRRQNLRYVRARLTHLLLVLLAVTFLSFVVVALLPGDAAVVVAGENATPEQVQEVRETLQLDRPLLVRYVDWLGGVVTGDLGSSFRTGQPVLEAL